MDLQLLILVECTRNLKDPFEAIGAKGVVDSACSQGDWLFLIKSEPSGAKITVFLGNAPQGVQPTSLRQTAERGMRVFKSSFPRMKDRLLYEESGERLIILESYVLALNLRTRLVR